MTDTSNDITITSVSSNTDSATKPCCATERNLRTTAHHGARLLLVINGQMFQELITPETQTDHLLWLAIVVVVAAKCKTICNVFSMHRLEFFSLSLSPCSPCTSRRNSGLLHPITASHAPWSIRIHHTFPPPRHYLHALNLPLCFNAFPHTLFSFPSPPGPQLFLLPFASLEPLILSTVFLLLLPRLVRSPPLHFRFWHRSLVNSLDLSLALFLFSLCANSRTWTLYASCLASPNTSCMEKTRPPTPGSPHRSTNEIANTFAADQNWQTKPQSVIRDLGARLEDFRCKLSNTARKFAGNFEQVQFLLLMTFWPFLGSLFEQGRFYPLWHFGIFWAPPSLWTFHNVNYNPKSQTQNPKPWTLKPEPLKPEP